jgi:hypothetical protein
VAAAHPSPHVLHDLKLVAATHDRSVPGRGEPRGQGNRDPRCHERHGTRESRAASIVRSDPPCAGAIRSEPVMTGKVPAPHRLREQVRREKGQLP